MSRAWLAALMSPPYAALHWSAPGYLPDAIWQPGLRVLVPLGNSIRLAVLLHPASAPKIGVSGGTLSTANVDPLAPPASIELKPLLWPAEREPLLAAWYLDLAEQLALRQMRSPGQVLGSLLPLGLRKTNVRFEVRGGVKTRKLDPKALKALAAAWRPELAGSTELDKLAADWLEGRMVAVEARSEQIVYCTVAKDPPWPLRPAARRQIEAMEYLWERGSLDRKLLIKALGDSGREIVATLATKGLITIGARPDDDHCDHGAATATPDPECNTDANEGAGPDNIVFNPAQAAALEALRAALDDPIGCTRLLFGVTGSGKTAVYLSLAQSCLAQGRSVFLLAPELALALNLYKAARAWFPEHVASGALHFYHGYQSAARRERTFREVAGAVGPVLAVGTRSTLFLPVADPGLVVLDEEHDGSFKQDERMQYQAKEVAFFLVRRSGGLLLLGSATPDVKTYYAAEQGAATAVVLEHRAGGGELPAIRLVDIRGQTVTDHLLAAETTTALKQTLARGEQAIILLNRRGYAPLMYCLDCGIVAKCPDCEIGLTYHKGRERLVCHYCGLSRPFPLICPGCGGCHYLPMGEGTEKLEESLSALVPPTARVLRLDRDSTRKPGRMEEILESFGRGEAQLMVGTQMLSKGHHFPEVTTVVVADADMGLNLPDYRATERTFQLLVQVAGRAGRGEKPGEVLIQTRDPSNASWGFVRTGDYLGFYRTELELRRKRRYPPFVKLGLIRIQFALSFENGPRVLSEASRLGREVGKSLGVQFLGPAPAPLRMLRGWKRFHCLLKSEDWPSIRAVYGRLRAGLPASEQLRLALDLDPVDML